MKMEKLKFRAVDEDGRQVECDTLFMFDSPETGKSYIVYTDNSVDEEGNIRVYASIYNPADINVTEDEEFASLNLMPIETDQEWKMIEAILEEAQNQVEDAE